MKSKVYIRVNAEKNKGLGHWVRCIALADMLKAKFNCIFLLQTENRKIVNQTTRKGFVCHLIPSDLPFANELSYLKNHFLNGDEIIVLDGYSFNSDYQKEIKKMVGKLVCIDDIHDTHFHADIVINHSGGINAKDYSCSNSTKLCLGFEYLLLRKEFLNNTKLNTPIKNDFESIFICLGGEDPNNDTLKVLQQCEEASNINNCQVVIGSAYAHKETLDKFVANSNLSIDISQSLNAEELFTKMSSCSSAICSPSTIALEYLSISGNLFLHQTADNQKYLYKYFIDNGLAFSLNRLATVNTVVLEKARLQQKKLVDGKSPQRLLGLFENLQLSLDLKFRLAKVRDLHQYYVWANEAATREQSFQSARIPFEDHQKWFKRQLNSQSSVLIIVEWKKESIGQIRFNIQNDQATISYSLDQNFRGKGLARQLISRGIKFLKSINPEINKIEGFVKLDNYPSIKTFKRMGFKEQKIEIPFQHLKYIQSLKQVS